MRVTERQLNRATLRRQLLLERSPLGAAEAVRRIGAIQAQEPASPYLALWSRLADFDPGDLDEALAGRRVVRASLMRMTLHLVHAEDYPSFHEAMVASLRASRLFDRRFTGTGVPIAEVDRVLPEVLDFTAVPRTGEEVAELLRPGFGEHAKWVWWALRTFAPLHRSPTGGAWSFGPSVAFVAAGTRPVVAGEPAAVGSLVRRYLEAFGPATVADVARFTLLRRPVITQALRELDQQLRQLDGPTHVPLYDVAGAQLPDPDIPAPPRLLPMWDSVLLAHAGSRILPGEHRAHVIRRNGDVLPTVLLDGQVAGVWRPAEGGIEVTAFRRLDGDTWTALAAEARSLVGFLAGRDPGVYRRSWHWWEKGIPAAQVRLLPG